MLAEQTPARFVGFDLLARDDESLLDRPFSERRALLEQIARARPDPARRHAGGGRAVAPERRGRGGQETDAPYRPGARKGMVKVKRLRTIDAVVAGYRPGKEEGPSAR